MRSLSSLILLLLGLTVQLFGQSPHGVDMKINCAACHTTLGWAIPDNAWHFQDPAISRRSPMTGMILPTDTVHFNHYRTDFPLLGLHASADCRTCHANLVFSEASTECISCHTDMHNQTVGQDCTRCHNSESWLVEDVTSLHLENGFPLVGPHAMANCVDCHTTASELRFDRIGNECINCHSQDYAATTSPNHGESNFSVNCIDCHDMNGFGWSTDVVNHSFFPLTGGHDLDDCTDCHTNGTYTDTPRACAACHQMDFTATQNPAHQELNLPTDCQSCHTIDPGWMPATFPIHDQFYPLLGAHATISNDCASCHNGDYNYTPNTCIGCHAQDYEATTDPVHKTLQFSNECASCHTENAWAPATFEQHDAEYFPIYSGTHQGTWEQCKECHMVASNYAIFSCTNCHVNPETDNAHAAVSGYVYNSNACLACHPTGTAGTDFDHDQTGFPLVGAHQEVTCIACHLNGYKGTPTDCVGCHMDDFNQTTDPDHVAGGIKTECTTCHTEDAWAPVIFDHNTTMFPLRGAHTAIQCQTCHTQGYRGMPTDCAFCHTDDFNATTDPDHVAGGIKTECATCHTEDAWEPVIFDHNTTQFPLRGAHTAIQCQTCHTQGYRGMPTDCAFCHTDDFNQTTNPNHSDAQFPTDCTLCHAENSWTPSSFDHDGQNFPIYSGTHAGAWDQCADCHTTPGNFGTFSCIECHAHNNQALVNRAHQGVGGYSYRPTSCYECHPKGKAN